MNIKVEDLRRKAWLAYGGEKGLTLVNQQVIAYGKDEENLTEQQEKELLNQIIKAVFVGPFGLEKAKLFLSRDVKNLPAYDLKKRIQTQDSAKVVREVDKVKILDRINLKPVIIIFFILAILAVPALFISYASVYDPSDTCRKNSGSERENCFLILALKKNNISFCQEMSSVTNTHGCFSEIAVRLNSTELCDSIPRNTPSSIEQNDKCMMCVAYRMQDLSKCHLLKDQIKVDECRKQIERGYSAVC
ncbi:MAG: hypothetical protein KKD39_07265 [Candidatus Altiarchaeota archaeon]|nr:hypothetical protein [Candidatus Altiarchaeota archaeon]